MAAGLTDLFRKSGAGTVTTLEAPGKALAANSITVGSTENYPTDTGIIIAIRVVDSTGALVDGTYTEWKATVSSETALALDPTPVYGSDQVYAAGSTTQVFIPVSAKAQSDMVDGILEEHNQDGTHKFESGIGVLGYAEVTGNLTTASAGTQVQATGLTATVTVPAGGRKVKITGYATSISAGGACYITVGIWEGTVATGTELAMTQPYSGGTGQNVPINVCAIVTPSAGSHTYNIGWCGNSGTATLAASATTPAYILVEYLGGV